MQENNVKNPNGEMSRFYRFIKRTFSGIFKLLLRIKIKGTENEPLDKNFIVCCNHTSLFDVVVISIGLKRQVNYLAKKEVFKVPVLRGFVKAMGAVAVDRKKGDVGAIKKMVELLKDGSNVGIFPQGTRCPYVNPRETDVKDGMGMIAQRAGVGILPVAVKTKKGKLKFFRKTEFIIGEYIPPEALQFEGTGKERYEKITGAAFDKVCALLEGEGRE